MKTCPRCDIQHGRSHTYCLECHLAYNREWRRRNPGYLAAYRAANPEKTRAHRAVERAVKSGRLNRPEICPNCSQRRLVQAHHKDYAKPLEVLWLCASCHGLIHAREGAQVA